MPGSPSTWSMTARPRWRARRAPTTTWSILDRDLPVVHGDRVCRQLVRDGSPVRILMLTAATDVEDRVDGLELGADDYLGKPFAFQELIARIRALGRRGPGTPAIVQRGDLVVDRNRHRASRGGVPLTLTRKEFGVLERLAAADGAPVSAEELLEHVWDAHADPLSNTVAVTIGAVAPQARRSAADRDRRRRGLPAVRLHLSARSRLTLFYTSLFAVGGAALVAVTYLLVAHSLAQHDGPDDPRRRPTRRSRAASRRCRTRVTRAPCRSVARCMSTACRPAPPHSAARRSRHLLTYSLLGLAGVTLLAVVAGWIVAGRILRPVHRLTAAARAASEQKPGPAHRSSGSARRAARARRHFRHHARTARPRLHQPAAVHRQR